MKQYCGARLIMVTGVKLITYSLFPLPDMYTVLLRTFTYGNYYNIFSLESNECKFMGHQDVDKISGNSITLT